MKNARTIRAAALLAAGSLMAAAAMAGAVQLNTNLLSNGTAEAGEGSPDGNTVLPVPKWTTAGNFTVVLYGAPAFPTLDGPGPAKRGLKFFSGGPDNGLSTMSRTLNLKPLAADIDTGTVKGNLSGYLGGYASQEDHADVAVTWIDATGAELGTTALQTVTATDRASTTGLLKRKTVGSVPSGTRSARVLVTMTRQSGAYNDGYADSLSLILTKP